MVLKAENMLQELNSEQKEAVYNTEGPLLILAGAGSGKTRVLTYRIAYLLQEGRCSPEEILALTFTNKAADEMKERIENLTELKGQMWISTFHSMCSKILRNNINRLGYVRNFTIIDSQDQRNLLRECIKELGFNKKKYTPKEVLPFISNAKNELIEDKFFMEKFKGMVDIAEIYTLYQKKLKNSNCLDFDDLLMLTAKLFETNLDVLEYYQDRFHYILVDEYQDTNRAQYVLVKMLADKHRNLCVVGDDDQSIYKFRGADIRNILDFEKDYPDVQIIKLEKNYRSAENILETAFHIVKNNKERKEKRLYTDNPPGEKVNYYNAYDQHNEARFVVEEIKRQRDSYEKFAVLYRTNAQSRILEEKFIRENISYKIYGGLKFYDRKEIKDILAYLKVAYNPADNVSLRRIINVPKRGIGIKTEEKLMAYCKEEDLTLFEGLKNAKYAGISGKALKSLNELAMHIDNFRQAEEKLSLKDLTKKIVCDIRYLEELKKKKDYERISRTENIQELIAVAHEHDMASEDNNLESFLTNALLMASAEDIAEDGEEELVCCMTLHNAKGLEFPVVFLVGMEEQFFPHRLSVESEDGDAIEEERRLCYVGCTRAMKKLYFVNAKQRRMPGKTIFNPPSRFIKEVPEELINFLS